MTTGMVASGRAEAFGSGTTLGIGAELGSGRAVGSETAVGKGGITDGNGSTLATGTARVGTATVGRGATDGSAGRFGVCGVAVHPCRDTGQALEELIEAREFVDERPRGGFAGDEQG